MRVLDAINLPSVQAFTYSVTKSVTKLGGAESMTTPVVERTAQQATAEANWQSLLEDQAESAPGTYLQEGEVLSRGQEGPSAGGGESDDVSVPMRVSSLKFKGYVRVWDTLTGVESLQPWWLLWQTMRKRREDGSLVFTRTDPHIPPDYGDDLFCPLNPEAPADQRFAGKGFQACKKKHIPHWDGLQRHIRKSHGRAWEAMELERRQRERKEDRDLQHAAIQSQQEFMQVMMQNAAAAREAPGAILSAVTVQSNNDLYDNSLGTPVQVTTGQTEAQTQAQNQAQHTHARTFGGGKPVPGCPRCAELLASP